MPRSPAGSNGKRLKTPNTKSFQGRWSQRKNTWRKNTWRKNTKKYFTKPRPPGRLLGLRTQYRKHRSDRSTRAGGSRLPRVPEADYLSNPELLPTPRGYLAPQRNQNAFGLRSEPLSAASFPRNLIIQNKLCGTRSLRHRVPGHSGKTSLRSRQPIAS